VPLPVTGSTTVSGAVAATQSGAWNVGITGTPTFKNADEPGRQPFEIIVEYDPTQCDTNCVNFSGFGGKVLVFDSDPPVPANHRWVIKHISGLLPTGSGTDAFIALQTQQVLSQQNLKFSYSGPFYPVLAGTQEGFTSDVFTTIDPGQRAHVQVRSSLFSSGILSNISLSGYLIAAN
jgi:hypothetical protein